MNILFFSNDGKLGDGVLHTALVKGIKQQYPDAKIYCTTAGSTTDFWQRDCRIEESWDFWKPSFWQAIKLGLTVRKKKLDYIISWNPIKNEKLKIFCWLANPKFGTKVFVVKPDEHASIKEKRVLEMLGCENSNISYDIAPSSKMASYQWQKNSLFFNIFASIESRTINVDDAVIILNLLMERLPDTPVYMAYYADKKAVIDEIINKTVNKNIVAVDSSDGMEKLFSLCSSVDVIISPDTAIVHIASAYNKPTIALFERNNSLLQTNWAPTSDRYSIIDFFANESDKNIIFETIADLAVSYMTK
ncbi:ADP-heptose:LPS heptosyltransferase [Orbus hercynius]|uniref:ADP-heptose:LPS heptosyltransferase n=1 Tax=Orbus hercynius TaxID=593135 RepID=A0A495RJU0_9GAMM|nr:glycosyltransferase family 9 protein [Orbus hercynius]RKS87705.1 ADP-heptose:LPS heptosyltransferase [Orbus hercynius]